MTGHEGLLLGTGTMSAAAAAAGGGGGSNGGGGAGSFGAWYAQYAAEQRRLEEQGGWGAVAIDGILCMCV